jgi:hypothetical protein
MSKLITIQQCITEIDPSKLYKVAILKGAAEELVSHRELRKKYETNQDIRIWSAFFLLKAMTTAPFIKNWRNQSDLILTWLQMEEKTFYWILKKLKKLNLAMVDDHYGIHLAGWEQAAHILNIVYTGTTIIQFNPYKYAGKQTFQYILRGEEIQANQKDQRTALMNRIDKNPPLKDILFLLMVRTGADEKRLKTDRVYFQERLLQTQQHLFKEGSELIAEAFMVRADLNRGVKKIAEHHHYKAPTSVSYMKRRMARLGRCVDQKNKSGQQNTQQDLHPG